MKPRPLKKHLARPYNPPKQKIRPLSKENGRTFRYSNKPTTTLLYVINTE